MDPSSTLDQEQFITLLQKIDAGLRALPATAQVARQQVTTAGRPGILVAASPATFRCPILRR